MGIINPGMFPIIFGAPVYVWGGIITAILFLAVFVMGLMISSGKGNFTMKQHKILAIIAMLLALGHAGIGILIYFG